MKVLIACEESQEVCKAFRLFGHEAYSCDVQEPSGGHPEWHILGDAVPALRGGANRHNGRQRALHRCVGPAHCAPAVHIPFKRRSATPMERPPATRGPRNERDFGTRPVYEILVGGHPKNMRRKPGPEQGVLSARIYADYSAVPVWTPIQQENLPVAEKP